jgi:hypothetical protein
MRVDKTRGWGRKRTIQPLRAAVLAVLVCGYGAGGLGHAAASGLPVAGAQTAAEDPCRFFAADAMGKAFGRTMKSSKLGNVCEYRGTGTDRVVVQVKTGPEGTIFRHSKAASAQNNSGAKKVRTTVGEAYVDTALSGFIGRVGNREVQIETTIEPFPNDAMVAVGSRILESLAGK